MAKMDATRACVVCGVLFPRDGKRTLCSEKCKAERQRMHFATYNAKRKSGPRQCGYCHSEFQPARGVGNRYCCAEHADLGKAKRDKERKARPDVRAKAMERQRGNRRAHGPRKLTELQRQRANEKKRGRARDYAKENGARMVRKLADLAPALLWIDADYLLAHTEALAINAEFDRAVRSAARAASRAERDERDALRIEQAKKRGLAASTLKLKEDPEAYAVCLARWRAKSFKRKTGREMPADGTVSGACLGGKHCIYCNIALTACNRTIDHMTPLVLGGVHSATNIAPCCKTCNASKSGQGFHSYVARLSPANRMRAVKFFERMNGPLEQMTLWLAA